MHNHIILYTGQGAATFINLPTGDVVANFEGVINATTLTCNVTNEGIQIGTFWSVANFDNVLATQPLLLADPDSDFFLVSGDQRPNVNATFGNHITVLNWTLAVDSVILFCGTGRMPHESNVTLRIYSKCVLVK